MDIDAIAKKMPDLIAFKERMERLLANPFAAVNEAEQADVRADFDALREFKDQIPRVMNIVALVEAGRGPTESTVAEGEPSTEDRLDGLKKFVEDAVDALDAKITGLNDRMGAFETQIGGLTADMTKLATLVEGMATALDFQDPDLGKNGAVPEAAGEGASTADAQVPATETNEPLAPAGDQPGVRDPS